ncbi:DUF6402 family protein [uncultured Aquimarina sp.]|uniref:DUF6402 family protein n=1 Tax=uncultured Aquimarina sp. TaxID=575652 RepID=UPI0026108C6F|nr:DUF6402 family protein [uncultured Aquimarina sp.]
MILQFETDRVTLNFLPEIGIKQNQYVIKAYAKNPRLNQDKVLIYTSEPIHMKDDKNSYFLDIDYWYYTRVAKYINVIKRTLPTCIDFYFSICIGNEENEIPNPYRVHFIKYIPDLLEIAGYKQAKKAHGNWFCLPAEDNPEIANPILDFIDFTTLLETSSRFEQIYQVHYEKIIAQISRSNRNEIKKSLVYQVQKMIDIYREEEAYSFGILETELVDQEEALVPLFDTNHFYEMSLQEYFIKEIDDDMDGLLFNDCSMRVIAFGKISKKETHLGIHIERLGFYLKDQYSFENENEEISLSYCEIIDKGKVIFNQEPIIKEESFKITPANYSNYRKDHELGGDFNWYSTIHFKEVSIELIL